ncbi:MAG: ABC transporter substrate-binding protein [Clostridia bacterium]|nr:ABC transporter substrate-binding protein [Clostridia bacterium]
MKRIIALLLCLSILLSLSACAGNKDDAKDTTPETEAETVDLSKYETQYPLTITDHLDREVVIEAKPEKLVSAYYISTSVVIALGLEDKLVGIEAKADTRNIYKHAAPEIVDLPSVGTAKNFDVEGCAALNPDLVIIPVKLSGVIEQLEALGITVLAVNPESSDELIQTIVMISKATDTFYRGSSVITEMTRALAKLGERISDVEEKPTVYLASNSALLSTAGAAMYQNALIEKAGCVNVAKDITDTYWAEVSYEQLLTWNPDYIVLASDSEYTVESVLEDENLAALDAVKNKNVIKLPGEIESWDSPVPGSFVGSLWLASQIHAKEYSVVECNSVMTKFYKEFYGFAPDLFE